MMVGLALDTVDGIVARLRCETSLLGSVLDIAIDRTYEIVLWICFADRGLIPILIPIIVVVRSALTDGFRGIGIQRGTAPFAQLRTRLGRFLVASSWTRSAYGFSKVIAFGGLALLNAFGTVPAGSLEAHQNLVVQVAVWICVSLCIVRGLPVVLEGILQQRMNPGGSSR